MKSFDFLGNKIKYFDRVISLGSTSEVAHQLRRIGLRQESMPFDWLSSYFDDDLFLKAFRTDFSNWLSLKNLKVDEETTSDYLSVTDTYYNMIHPYIFPKILSVKAAYPDVNATTQKRVTRLIELQDKKLDLLFIRTNMTAEKAKELSKVLSSKFGPNVTLLIINHTSSSGLRELPCSIRNTYMFEMDDDNKDNGGNDTLWNELLKNVRLKECWSVVRYDNYFTNAYPCEIDEDHHYFRWAKQDATLDLSRFLGQYIRLTLKSLSPITVDLLDGDKNLIKEFTIETKNEICFKVETNSYTLHTHETVSPARIFGGNDTRELGPMFYDFYISMNEIKPVDSGIVIPSKKTGALDKFKDKLGLK